MPGSISTSTAPSLNRANVSAKELQARRHHQDGPHAAADADGVQAAGDAVAFVVELLAGEMCVGEPGA